MNWTEQDVAEIGGQLQTLRDSIARVIVGQHDVVEQVLTGLLAGGHVLLEGVPGLGKTLLVRTLAEALSLQFNRIQFTPDLMPADILGTEILEEEHGSNRRVFKFQPGPIFTQLLLADEINRTPPKTQSALLEAMQERAVTVAGQQRKLPQPFFVLATQNPVEQAGTYPLPEAQLDRFLLNIVLDYPDEQEEIRILTQTTAQIAAAVTPVVDAVTVQRWQQLTRDILVADRLVHYAAQLVRATRPAQTSLPRIRDYLAWGAGPRAGQSLLLAAKARALLQGRLAVTREDLRAMLAPVLRHRVILQFQAEADGVRFADLLNDLLSLPMPD